jgi:uncharacterized repeat protein (TIGR03803 family)
MATSFSASCLEPKRRSHVRGNMKTSAAHFIILAVVMFLPALGHAQIFTVIATVENLGIEVSGPVVRDIEGNIYGASSYYGNQSCNQWPFCGFIYKVDPTGKLTVLYNFRGQPDGAMAMPGLVLDSAGSLYGVTEYGGTYNFGAVFKLDSEGNETVLHSFAGPPNDGEGPLAGLIADSNGNLYGTTFEGGLQTNCSFGCGTVFKVTVTGKETVLYRFNGGADGATPFGASLLLSGGALYGTTLVGGNTSGFCQGQGFIPGCGTVFKVDKAGETVLHSFIGTDGIGPVAGVIRDSGGNLYGTAPGGGDLTCNSGFGCGVVYKLDPSGNETVLHVFENQQDGQAPNTALVFDQDALYGSSEAIFAGGGIFKIDSSGNFSMVYQLPAATSTMIGDREDNLYGVYGDQVFRFAP